MRKAGSPFRFLHSFCNNSALIQLLRWFIRHFTAGSPSCRAGQALPAAWAPHPNRTEPRACHPPQCHLPPPPHPRGQHRELQEEHETALSSLGRESGSVLSLLFKTVSNNFTRNFLKGQRYNHVFSITRRWHVWRVILCTARLNFFCAQTESLCPKYTSKRKRKKRGRGEGRRKPHKEKNPPSNRTTPALILHS